MGLVFIGLGLHNVNSNEHFVMLSNVSMVDVKIEFHGMLYVPL